MIRIFSIDNFKWWFLCWTVDWAVVSKLNLRNDKIPFLRMLPHYASQQISKRSIHNFCLSISLRVVSTRELQPGTQELPKSSPKITNKLYIMIWSNGLRNSMKTNHFFEKQSCYMRYINRILTWYKMNHLWDSIHHNENAVKTMLCSRYTKNKVHRKIFSRFIRNG